MKRIISFSGLFLLCFLATALHAREVSWNKFTIPLTEDWKAEDLENNTSSQLTLVSEQQGVNVTIKLSFRPVNKKPVANQSEWLVHYSEKWTSFKFSNSKISEKGPVTVLGQNNCPMAAGQNKTMSVYQFLPMIDGYIYSIIVNLTPASDKPLPLFIMNFLERISFDHHGGIQAPETIMPRPDEKIPEKTTDQPLLPPPSLSEQFSETELKALDNRVTSVSDLFEKGNKEGLASALLPEEQTVIQNAIKSSTPQELARFGNALKSRRITAMGRNLVEYEITDGANKYAVSFILMDGKWYLYHF